MEYTKDFLSYFFYNIGYLSPVVGFLLIAVLANGIIIGRLENWTKLNSIYHALINATTVGYGDFRPTRPATKILSILNAFLGVLLTGIIVAAGVHALNKTFDTAI